MKGILSGRLVGTSGTEETGGNNPHLESMIIRVEPRLKVVALVEASVDFRHRVVDALNQILEEILWCESFGSGKKRTDRLNQFFLVVAMWEEFL